MKGCTIAYNACFFSAGFFTLTWLLATEKNTLLSTFETVYYAASFRHCTKNKAIVAGQTWFLPSLTRLLETS
jgi:hypothetical protein